LGHDADWRYDTQDVIRLGRELEHVKPMWLEDPVPPDNIDAMARVTHSIGIPVCTRGNLYGRQGFRKLIEMQACSGVHIDVPKSGGLLELKNVRTWRTFITSGRPPQSGGKHAGLGSDRSVHDGANAAHAGQRSLTRRARVRPRIRCYL